MGRKKEILEKRIITYNGQPVLSTEINLVENQTKIKKVICTCGRIVQQAGWQIHTRRALCVEYHMINNENPECKLI